MAIFHLRAQMIQRSKGRNIIAAAAYRACEKLHDLRKGETFNYSSKKDLVQAEIFVPAGAPDWMKERERVWNHLDGMERQWNGVPAREVQVSLPVELTQEQNWALAQDFARHFTDQGMIADVAFHAGHDNEQPHLHVLLSMREVQGHDFARAKNRTWNRRDWLEAVRMEWETLTNHHLAIHGHDVRIDRRSYQERGIDLVPQNKIGVSATRARREVSQGQSLTPNERMDDYHRITERNGKAIIADPTIALKLLSSQQSTFSDADIARVANRYSDSAEQFVLVYQGILQSPELVSLGRNQHNEMRYTSQELLTLESDLVAQAIQMASEHHHPVAKRHTQKAIIKKTLSASQAEVLNALVHGSDAVAVVGFAGTGKTHVLGAARDAWVKSGYRVRGLALAGRAADGLLQDANIESRTIASHLLAWNNDRERLSKEDILVIDEAGMVDSRLLSEVMTYAKDAGAKVVLVGDHTQLQPIGAGAAFRAILERIGFASLTDVRRQRQQWMQEASKDLALGRTRDALAAYERHGFVHNYQSQDKALQATVDSWWSKRGRSAEVTATMSAFMRKDVAQLNALGRLKLREAGVLGKDVTITINDGRDDVKRQFAIGDEIYFLKNEKGLGVTGIDSISRGVKNGTRGIIKQASSRKLTVALIGDERREITFDVKDYNHFDYAYAATVHKLQGATFTHNDYFPSFNSNRYLSHVALTRHKETCDIHWSDEGFHHGYASLAASLSREQVKDFTLDYRTPRSLERETLIDVDNLLINESRTKAVNAWMNDIDFTVLANNPSADIVNLLSAKEALIDVAQKENDNPTLYREKQRHFVEAALLVKQAHQDYGLLSEYSPEIIQHFTDSATLATIEKSAQQLSPAIPKKIHHNLDTYLDDVLSSFDWATLERDKNKHPALSLLVQAKSDYDVSRFDQTNEHVLLSTVNVKHAINSLVQDEHLYHEVTRLSSTLIEPLQDIQRNDFMNLSSKEQFNIIYESIDWQAIEENKNQYGAFECLLEDKADLARAYKMNDAELIGLREKQLLRELCSISSNVAIKEKVLDYMPSLEKTLTQSHALAKARYTREWSIEHNLESGVDF